MNKVRIKICGIKEIQIIDCCINRGVDYFGLIFYKKSPRNINLNSAIKLLDYIKNKKIIPVGVFVNEPINDLKEIIKKTKLNHNQLHGKEDYNYIEILKKKFDLKIIKCLGIESRDDIKKKDKFHNADYLLFDYKARNYDLPGGNAKRFDWSILEEIEINKPWFISGGININNVEEIHNKLIPYGIDISSGVEEKPGIKSILKISELMKKLNV